MFRHPKYYKELRKRNKSDQIISPRVATASARRASGPGLHNDIEEASSGGLTPEASSAKQQGPSIKPQALKLSNQPG